MSIILLKFQWDIFWKLFFFKNLCMHVPFLNLVVLRFWWRWQFHCVVNDQRRGGAPGWIARDVLFWSQPGAFDQSACTPALTVVPSWWFGPDPRCVPDVYSLYTGWWFGTCSIFPYDLGMSSSQLTKSNLFQRGRAQPPGALGPKKKLTKTVLKSFWRIQRATS